MVCLLITVPKSIRAIMSISVAVLFNQSPPNYEVVDEAMRRRERAS